MRLLIKNGRVIDPGSKQDEVMDLLIEDGKIVKKKLSIEDNLKELVTIDATGCFVMPGFIDLHVHLREPGFEQKETIASGASAAARGGFTTICAMPNTKPVIDNADKVRFVLNKAAQVAPVNVCQVGAITVSQLGEKLADIEGMAKAGAIAISEDGKSVMNVKLYEEAMKLAKKCEIPVMAHCEDKNLVGAGVLNKGEKATQLQVEGISNLVEDVIIARDIMIAKETNAKLHLCHCSTKDSVTLVEEAKKKGIQVTAEVCPHHFALTEDDIINGDTNYKMNPPLRTKEDVKALKLGLKNDIMDVIATDHAPHHESEKAKSLKEAPFGIVGLETAVGLTITELVDKGYLTPMQMAEKLSYNPAKIIGLDKGTLEIGKVADVVIINPDMEYTVDVKDFASMGKNTPFAGMKLKGQVMATIVNGKVVYQYTK
ncbi:dihydroorotase [Candidatus Galacturonibacter soehngenii]|uniref:Dihydroorotase n=1 Tax=Candidatus Galacturonatibacter soehngenii TaxID=2307010 RepID=A0A7V7QNY9_9FIRM|nr:dihydroorotase [Candidatus Galacturonibacter soehngenii]KAB1441007.1 dihydroorotase [Candidatus Galacturonibacter soehngenii]MBA4688424.1 dihydroorotase [Candidatus Galacturonibacter soehngenii]